METYIRIVEHFTRRTEEGRLNVFRFVGERRALLFDVNPVVAAVRDLRTSHSTMLSATATSRARISEMHTSLNEIYFLE